VRDRWWSVIDRRQWHALGAAMAGWLLDGMDVMLFTFALNAIRAEFGLSGAAVGSLASVSLLASAGGGILFGYLADRYGRVRALSWSILLYSVSTALTATARSLPEMMLWRVLLGIGLGGEWSAGAVLVVETWPPRHRGKAIGIMQSGWALGYLAAAVLAAFILPAWGWRALFAVGIAPALLTLWIRHGVPEPDAWAQTTARSPHRARELAACLDRLVPASALAASVLFAYWGLFTWLPAYLGAARLAGGAGLGLVRTSAWMVPVELGAFAGYVSFGFLADRFGRKPVFIVFVAVASVLVPVYGGMARSRMWLLALGPLVGFFGHGYFSVFGALLAELFPAAIRATAQGICYNVGRALSAVAPAVIGALADRVGIGGALSLTSGFFLSAAGLILLLPATQSDTLTAR
jgi:MFS family permease